MENYRAKLFILFITVTINLVFSQQLVQLEGLQYNFENVSDLLEVRKYDKKIGQKYNSMASTVNPDFGFLPYNAPNRNVVEVIDKRKLDERYYVDIDNPLFFYIQKSSKPLNFYRSGHLIAINPTLSEESDGVYTANNQPYPTELDFNNKCTKLSCNNYKVENNKLSLKVINNQNQTTTYTSNWTNYVVGNNGAIVTDIFPGIDMRILFDEGSIKSNFIIKSKLNNVSKLVFIDNLNLGNGLSLFQQSGTPGSLFVGDVNINDLNNNTQFVISKSFSYDASGQHGNSVFNNYRINGSAIELHMDSAFLNSHSVLYPVTVDPLFTAVGPIAAPANSIGSLPAPAVCTQVLNVTFPGGSTPWDFSTQWSVAAAGCCASLSNCFMNDAQLWFNSSCGGASPVGAPATIWRCVPVACLAPGNWNPTLPFNSSGTQSMVQCYPALCTNQTLTFTLSLNRLFCANTAACNCTYATNTCIRLNSWNVTIQGRSVETLANTATGNGNATQAATCYSSVTLNPTPLYGVGPYTYLWNPGGATSPTIAFTPTNVGSSVFTATVTDACGTIRVATITVNNNCVLPVTLTYFRANYNGFAAEVEWETVSEVNSDYFILERSTDAKNYTMLGKIPAAGYSAEKRNYKYIDSDLPDNRIAYYRLRQYDKGGIEKFNLTTSIQINEQYTDIVLLPNPTINSFDILLSNKLYNQKLLMEIRSADGKLIKQLDNIFISSDKNAIRLNVEDLVNGIYTLLIYQPDGSVVSKKLVKQ